MAKVLLHKCGTAGIREVWGWSEKQNLSQLAGGSWGRTGINVVGLDFGVSPVTCHGFGFSWGVLWVNRGVGDLPWLFGMGSYQVQV